MNKAVIHYEIDNCCQCPHSYQEQVHTPDPFELEVGCYCSKTPDKTSYNKKHRLVAADENIERWALIPDWCPLLVRK